MKLIKGLAVLLLFVVPLFAGCAEKEKVDEAYMQKLEEIEKTQKDMLAKLESIEADQKEIAAFFKQIKAAQKGKPSIDYDKVHNIPVGDSPVRGNPSAPVTIVEFSDFECPYCARLQPTLKKVLDAYPDKVKLVYKDFPLSFHKQARDASKAAFAAGEQGRYWEMHDLIFENYNKLSGAKFMEFAESLGLDIDRFTKDFRSNKYDARIQRDIALGQSVGVRGTPSLYMNGRRMKSRSYEYFASLIEGYLKN